MPVWVENQSSSNIKLTLTDDFALGDVVLAGSNQAPILQPGEVLVVGVLLLEPVVELWSPVRANGSLRKSAETIAK